MSRDKLVAYLWPERDDRARHLLAQTLYAVRRELGGDDVILGTDPVRLNPQLLPTDVGEFEALLDKGELEQGVALHRAPFLDGFHLSGCEEFERWQESARARFQARLREALVTLASRDERTGDAAARLARWKELAALDPYDASSAMGLMRAQAAAGNTSAASQHARTYATLVRQELESEPDPRVEALATQLRAEETRVATIHKPASDSSPPVPLRVPRNGGDAKPSRASIGTKRGSGPLDLLRRGTPLRLRLDLEPHEIAALDALDAREAAARSSTWQTRVRRRLHLQTRRSLWIAAGVAVILVGVLATGTALAFRGRRGADSQVAAADRVAVLPFAVHGGASYGYLRQAMAEVFSASLDGMDELRSADVGTVARAASALRDSTLDSAAARGVAVQMGAGHFLLGDITEASGILHVDAALYDVRDAGAVLVSRASAQGKAESVFRLVDSITARLAVNRSTVVDEGFRAAAASAPLTVLKPYLTGQRAFHEKRFGDAIEALHRAIAADSTFAPAWYQLAVIGSWMNDADEGRTAAKRAVALATGPDTRDRTLAEALLGYISGNADDAERRYRSLTVANRDDIAAWRGIGEVLFHYAWQRGRPVTESRDAWRHVLQASPDDWGALMHLSEIAAREGDLVLLDSLVRRQTARHDGDVMLLPMRSLLAFAAADSAAQQQALADEIKTTHFWPMIAAWMVAVDANELEGAERLVRNLLTPQRKPEIHALARVTLAELALAGGRWQAARAELGAADTVMSSLASRFRALALASPFVPATREEITSTRARLARTTPEAHDVRVTTPSPWLAVHDGLDTLVDSYLTAELSLRLGDAAEVERATARLATLGSTADARRLGRALASSLRSSGGRNGEPLAFGDSIPFSLAEASPYYSLALARYRRALALESSGDVSGALRLYASFPGSSLYDLVFVAPAQIARARILIRQGDADGARAAYAVAAKLWRRGDPDTRAQLADIQRALAQFGRR